MKKTSTLQNKIKAYSTIAISVVGVGALQSQVVYHDVNPDVVLTGASTFDIDMDGNSTNDFQAQTNGTYRAQLNNLIIANNGIAGNGSGAWYYAQAFAAPEPIGPALSNWNNNSRNILASGSSSSSSVYSWGYFGDGLEHYAGVKFKIGANTHYGWIRFTGIDLFGTTITIQDWAYNSVADQPINAGGGIVGINENIAADHISLYFANKKLNINNLNNTEKGVIKITNIMGQEVKTIGITDTKMTIDLNDFSAGVYIVTVNNGKNNLNKKFTVK